MNSKNLVKPFFDAIINGNLIYVSDILRKLGSRDKIINFINRSTFRDKSPIETAINFNRVSILKLLLENGGILKPEFFNVKLNSPEIIKIMLNNNINHNSSFLFSCLNDVDKVKVFLEAGANINVQDDKGNTPLIRAIETENIQVAEFLIRNGANVNLQNNIGGTPLIYAILRNNLNLVKLLIRNGADVDINDNNNFSPLDYANDTQNQELINFIEKIASTRQKSQKLKQYFGRLLYTQPPGGVIFPSFYRGGMGYHRAMQSFYGGNNDRNDRKSMNNKQK